MAPTAPHPLGPASLLLRRPTRPHPKAAVRGGGSRGGGSLADAAAGRGFRSNADGPKPRLEIACVRGVPAEVRPQNAATLRRVLRQRRVVCARGVVLDVARLCRVFGSRLQPANADGNAVQLHMVQHCTTGEEKWPSDLWHFDLSCLPRPASATLRDG